ncbi:outer membrane receptor protein involved in Fe transport [Larkinella arboricola]|uniref:Outer membrane receptor protein involved in Fe transport n=1 Tax=Larkinella arboricola TaxID=643671 RepID=A0A327WU52_LARAB|nr:outer membrane beta-barrel protein [Larkinella arboricola]RAJ95874.1 outer membrane receptor protein involved in Fe transport [Larkinella arboricola]
MKNWPLTLAFLLFSLPLTAASPPVGTVSGLVKDSAGKPLELVTLLLVKAGDSTLVKGAVSDAQGQYTVESVPSGEYRVAASMMGHQKVYSEPFTIDSQHNKYQLAPLVVQEETRQLDKVTVKAQKPFIEQHLDKTVLNVENSIVASGGTALEILEKAPGVVVNLQSGQISLKGRDNVLVMLDGKPTYLSTAEVLELLRNTPSNTVETIELITNPSARYDAAGTAGIINIRLKRNKSGRPLNGNLTVGTGYGRFAKYNAALTLNARPGKWSFFGNYAIDQRHYWSMAKIDRRLQTTTPPTLIQQENYRPIQNTSHTYRFGADYAFSKRTTLGLLVNGTKVNGASQGGATSTLYQSDVLTSAQRTQNDNQRDISRLAANVNFRHQFDTTRRGGKGRELLVDVDYSDASFHPDELFETRYFNARQVETGPRSSQHLDMVSDASIRAGKVDYIHPFDRQTTLEAGWKSSYVTLNNDLRVETKSAEVGQTVPWQLDTGRTNQFEYREIIHAGYLSGRRTWTGWTLQVGLRLEYTQTDAHSVTANSTVSRSYLNLFPNVTLTRKVGENHQFQYAFSRRIDRPNYQYLNPFIRVFDPYTYQQGNPYLKPQYTDAFQIGYSYKEETTVSLGYNRTRDVVVDINEQNDQTGVTRITFTNLARQSNISLTLSTPLRFSRWWSSRHSASIFRDAYRAELGGTPLHYRQLSANLNSSHTFVFGHGLTAELTASYNSPYVYSQNRMKAFGQVSIGVQKSLWQKKAVLRFNWNDLLQTQRFYGKVRFQNMDFRFGTYTETRVARLTFTYNFGNQKLKGGGNRRTVSEDEQRRMN